MLRWDYAFEAGSTESVSVADELTVDQTIETLPPPVRKSFARVIRDIEAEARADSGLEEEIADLERRETYSAENADLEQRLENTQRALDAATAELQALKSQPRKDAA